MGHQKSSLLEETKPSFWHVFPWIRVSLFLMTLSLVVLSLTLFTKKVPKPSAPTPQIIDHEELREGDQLDTIITPLSNADTLQAQGSIEVESSYESTIVEKPIPSKRHMVETKGDMVRLSRGLHFAYEFSTEEGNVASEERLSKDSYVAEYKLNIKLPKPSTTAQELLAINPDLAKILPDLPVLMESAQVSDFYYQLYKKKVERLEKNVLKLAELSTKHNFYDCETILNLTCPKSKHRMLLLQGDMDVVSDGSDGDRMSEMPSKIVNSTHYQPFTSYGWKKQTKQQNPMIVGWEKRIGNAKRELAKSTTTDYRKTWLKARIKKLQRGIKDMKRRSFLIAEHDPFIVMPISMLTNRTDPYAPRVGDYAVVIVGDKVYPAIVGDGGPTFKVGEASLRLAKQINANASPYSRPVSDLSVTYIVFSNSREKTPQPPHYETWRQKCADLLDSIGGLGEGYSLYHWKDTLQPQSSDTLEASP